MSIAGVYKMTMAEYQADQLTSEPSLSRSTIIDLLDCPARAFFNHPRLNPQAHEPVNETKFDVGSAAHNLLLEGGDSIFVVFGFDDWRNKEAQQARIAARECGKIPLLEKQYVEVYRMVEAATKAISECTELGIANLRKEGDSELSYIWEESGIWCRIRPDWIRHKKDLIIDYKTSATNVNPDYFSSHINKMGYGIQHAFYRRGVKAVEGKQPDFVIMAQETEPPYFCSFHGLDLQNDDMQQRKIEYAIKLWKECLQNGIWPGYPNRICYAEAKPWELVEWEMKRGGNNELQN